MKIALLGYGRMGQAIHQVAEQRGHQVVCHIDRHEEHLLDSDAFATAEVVIEFATPDSGYALCRQAIRRGKRVVTGSTGWHRQLKDLQEEVRAMGGGLFSSSNYSLGMNLMMIISEQLAQLMTHYNQYHPSIQETHHIHKVDAPSGTAITLAEGLLAAYPSLQGWTLQSHSLEPVAQDQLVIHSIREGEVPGIHTITYLSEEDRISITHEAFSRQGLALGACLAAEYLQRHPIGVWGMRDLIQETPPPATMLN